MTRNDFSDAIGHFIKLHGNAVVVVCKRNAQRENTPKWLKLKTHQIQTIEHIVTYTFNTYA